MKTFKQFCSEAYQIDEVAITASPQNPLQRIRQGTAALSKSPLVNNPITRTIGNVAGPVLGIANRAYNLDKAGKTSLGPLERTTATLSGVTPPGASHALGLASWAMEKPKFRKFDTQPTTKQGFNQGMRYLRGGGLLGP